MHALLFDWPWAGLLLAAVLADVLLAELRTTSARVPRWVLAWPVLLERAALPGDPA